MAGPAYVKTYQDTLSVTTTNSFFTLDFVDSGTLYFGFSAFSAGAQSASDGSSTKVELYYDADGTGNNMVLIDAIYTLGETYQHVIDVNVKYPYTPNVSRVLVRRTLFGTPVVAREVYAQWQGTVE